MILAIDPGTKTGWASSDRRSGSIALWREPRKGKPGREAVYYCAGARAGELRSAAVPGIPAIDDGPRETRLQRLRDWLMTWNGWGVECVVIEALGKGWTHGRSADANRVSCELRAIVKLWCLDSGVRLEEIEPADLKRFATGKGNAKKPEMVASAKARLGYQGEDEDEADAWWIRAWAEKFANVVKVGPVHAA